MTSRRRAVFHFATSVLLIAIADRLRTTLDFDPRPRWSSRWVLVGAGWSILTAWLHDVDAGELATNRRRRVVFGLVQNAVREALSRQWETAAYEFSMGGCLGSALYRLRYGVLGSPPGEE